jgi:hypothetical protein
MAINQVESLMYPIGLNCESFNCSDNSYSLVNMASGYSFYVFLDEVRLLPITPMQYLTLMEKVRVYFEYRKHFDSASTPESTALARWGMEDAEQDYEKYARQLGLKRSYLFLLRDAVY